MVVGGLGSRGRIEEAVFFHLLDQMIMIDQMIKIIQDREDQDQEEDSDEDQDHVGFWAMLVNKRSLN